MAQTDSSKDQKYDGPPRVFFINRVSPEGSDPLSGFVNKGDADPAVQPQAREREEQFRQLGAKSDGHGIIQPTFDFDQLDRLVWKNTILPPLIEVMEVNIDGTGYELVEIDENGAAVVSDNEDSDAKRDVKAFFDEPWPGESMLTIRRKLRRDQEAVGNAYLEVMRNTKGEVIFARYIDAKNVRLVQFDDPITVTRTVQRFGDTLETQIQVRERRFVQLVGGKIIYFKELGASRELNKETGEWATSLSADKRATELLHFTNKKDPDSPYGLPRWVSNAPSVVGSRKAEEFNLDFFDAGGVPPLLIIVSGGQLAQDADKALREHFLAGGVARHQAAILEAFSTSGDLDSSQNVRVTVERFGADRARDSMFENYSGKCDGRVRRSFRTPPMFTGEADDISFASAFASYTVAEAQVFKPEHGEFDEMVNLSLMPELRGGDKFVYRSLPVVAVGAERQLEALEIAQNFAAPGEIIESINQIANLSLRVADDRDESRLDVGAHVRDPKSLDDVSGPREIGSDKSTADKEVESSRPRVTKAELRGLEILAEDLAYQMLEGFRDDAAVDSFLATLDEIDTLHPSQEETFKTFLAHALFTHKSDDPEGARALAEGLLRQYTSKYRR